MVTFLALTPIALAFGVIALAAERIGQFFARIKLPFISGFLFAGILAGPYVLDLISADAVTQLAFVDHISLAFIAFAAGSELYLEELRSRLKSILWVSLGTLVAIPLISGLAVFFLADMIPFMAEMPFSHRAAVAILAGAILAALSPSSAIALVNELRARGPFTQTVLGVTMILDIVVIILFAISSSIADTLFKSLAFDIHILLHVGAEILGSVMIGVVLGGFLHGVLSVRGSRLMKMALILGAGLGAFLLAPIVREASLHSVGFELELEPLLICMVASFAITNYSQHREEFLHLIHDAGPLVYIAFFTLTGASLALDLLADMWLIALIIFAVRAVGIFVGSYMGGTMAGDSSGHNRTAWLTFVTMAGVALGLTKNVMVGFPEWGAAFATMIISVIVLSQIVGPPLFKLAINFVGEAHQRTPTPEAHGVRSATIFGLETQSAALARQLQSHGWEVRIATLRTDLDKWQRKNADVTIVQIPDLSLDSLRMAAADQAEAIVAMLSDDENFQVCEMAYEHFGTVTLVARLQDRKGYAKFDEIGAVIVEPANALIGLLDHSVRSPRAASLLMGAEGKRDIVEIEVQNPSLHGSLLRDLRLPLDTTVLSIQRNGNMLISHGYTRLERGDRLTMLGSADSLDEIMVRFGGWESEPTPVLREEFVGA
ncbi:MAG: cation:proton antiporter [Caldilineaceae bacterium]